MSSNCFWCTLKCEDHSSGAGHHPRKRSDTAHLVWQSSLGGAHLKRYPWSLTPWPAGMSFPVESLPCPKASWGPTTAPSTQEDGRPSCHLEWHCGGHRDCSNCAAFTQLLSQRSSKSFVVGAETDRQICTLWRSRPLTRGQARARHSSLQQTTEGGVAHQARGGEATPGGSVTHSKSHSKSAAQLGLGSRAAPPSPSSVALSLGH